MNYTLQRPTDKEFEQICRFIGEFELDNRQLKKEQFVVALDEAGDVLGFGRLRPHNDCMELCSLGVVTPYRLKGIGSAIVEHLLRNISKPVYLVCIIPDFFQPFGFEITEKYPASIQDKINYCTQELIVPETYLAMCYKRSNS